MNFAKLLLANKCLRNKHVQGCACSTHAYHHKIKENTDCVVTTATCLNRARYILTVQHACQAKLLLQFTSKTKTSALKLGKHARQRKGSRDRIKGQLRKRVLVTRAQAAEIRVIEHQKCNCHETPNPIQHPLVYVVGQARDEVSRKASNAP